MAYHSFEDLEVWKRACDLAVAVHRLLEGSREYAYRDQMVRSSLSIASNIAEGAERGTNADFIRFLHYAKGSSAELRSQLHIASCIGIVGRDLAETLVEESKELSKMLQGLIKRLNT